MFRLNEMAVFERVVREGSYTAAARELGLSKSSVSERVSRLERELGVVLLQRSTRSMRLTEVGRVYYEYCRRVVSEAREAAQAVRADQVLPAGLLRVAAPGVLQELLAPAVAAYLSRYSEVEVELRFLERPVDVIEEGFDVALTLTARRDPALHSRLLGHVRSSFVASQAYLDERGTPTRVEELADHHCILVGPRTHASWLTTGPQGPLEVPVRGRIAVNSVAAATRLARAGVGVALVPAFLAKEAGEAALCRILADCVPPMQAIHSVYSSARHLSARVRSLVDVLAEHGQTHW